MDAHKKDFSKLYAYKYILFIQQIYIYSKQTIP